MYRSGAGCDWRGALLLRLRAEVALPGRFFDFEDFELDLTALFFVEVEDFLAVVRLAAAAAKALPNKQITRIRVRIFRNFKGHFTIGSPTYTRGGNPRMIHGVQKTTVLL
jgi:hypothetical protein